MTHIHLSKTRKKQKRNQQKKPQRKKHKMITTLVSETLMVTGWTQHYPADKTVINITTVIEVR